MIGLYQKANANEIQLQSPFPYSTTGQGLCNQQL